VGLWPKLTGRRIGLHSSAKINGLLQMFRAGDVAAAGEAVLPPIIPVHWARFSSKITRSTSPGVLVLAAEEERSVVELSPGSGSFRFRQWTCER
jgi:hypothetical protein